MIPQSQRPFSTMPIKHCTISSCKHCLMNIKYSSIHPITGEKLTWTDGLELNSNMERAGHLHLHERKKPIDEGPWDLPTKSTKIYQSYTQDFTPQNEVWEMGTFSEREAMNVSQWNHALESALFQKSNAYLLIQLPVLNRMLRSTLDHNPNVCLPGAS